MKQHFIIFQSLCEEFKNAVQNILPEQEKRIDKVEWYEPRIEPFEDFLEEVQDWEELIERQGELEEQEFPAEEHESVEPVAASEQQ